MTSLSQFGAINVNMTGARGPAGINSALVMNAKGTSLSNTISQALFSQYAMVQASVTPANAFADGTVPNTIGYVDNVLRLRNLSQNGNVRGNAAMTFTNQYNVEVGAIGASPDAGDAPGSFYPNSIYIEFGKAFLGTGSPHSLKFICTLNSDSPYFPNSSLKAGEFDIASNKWYLRTFAGGSVNVDSDLQIGSVLQGTVYQFRLSGSGKTALRMREAYAANQFYLATNVSNLPTGSGIVQDDTTLSSWQMGIGAGENQFIVRSCAPGATSWDNHLRIVRSGANVNVLLLPTGTGRVGMGAPFVSASGLSASGYAEMLTSDGVTRKFMIAA